MNAAIVGLHEGAGSLGDTQQLFVQCGVIELLYLCPVKVCGLGEGRIFGDNAFGDVQGSGYLLV